MTNLRLRFFFVLLFLSTGSSAASAEPLTPESVAPHLLTHDYKYNEMAVLLTNVRDLKKLPDLEAFDEKTQLSGEPVEVELKELYKNVRETIFKNELVNLASCSDCHFRADYGSGSIFFRMDSILDLKKRYHDWKSVLTYILAHETSHLVQYISCHAPYTAQEGVSLNGLSIPCAEQVFPSDKAAEATRHFLHFHAETDTYTAIALSRAGFNTWDPVLSYLEDEAQNYLSTPNGFVVAADFRNRKRAIENFLLHKEKHEYRYGRSALDNK